MKEEQPQISEYPPIKHGEVFDPEKEILEVLKASRMERPAKLSEFKEKLAFQKAGLARVQDLMIDEIRRHPEKSTDELYEMATELGTEFGMNEKQKKEARKALEKYEKQHKAIEKIRKEHKKDEDVFKELFWKEPKGKTEVVQSPVSLYFKCYDFEDYLAVCYQERMRGFVKEKNFTDEEKKDAYASGARNVYSFSHPELGRAITVENTQKLLSEPTVDQEEYVGQKFAHEEQHIFYGFFNKDEAIDPNNDSTLFTIRKNYVNAKTEKEKEKVLKKFFRSFRQYADDRAKDEILAYYKDGRAGRTYNELTTDEAEGGIYDFLAKPKKPNYLWTVTNEEDTEFIKRISNKLLIEEYKKTITDGIEVIQKMEENGYAKDEIIALLTHEPLAKWGKVVGRIIAN
jgi:hypothetical protein